MFFRQAAQEAFRQLLDENFEKLKHDTTDEDLKVLFGDDSRFKNLESKERKAILNEKLAPLKKAHQESTFNIKFMIEQHTHTFRESLTLLRLCIFRSEKG